MQLSSLDIFNKDMKYFQILINVFSIKTSMLQPALNPRTKTSMTKWLTNTTRPTNEKIWSTMNSIFRTNCSNSTSIRYNPRKEIIRDTKVKDGIIHIILIKMKKETKYGSQLQGWQHWQELLDWAICTRICDIIYIQHQNFLNVWSIGMIGLLELVLCFWTVLVMHFWSCDSEQQAFIFSAVSIYRSNIPWIWGQVWIINFLINFSSIISFYFSFCSSSTFRPSLGWINEVKTFIAFFCTVNDHLLSSCPISFPEYLE